MFANFYARNENGSRSGGAFVKQCKNCKNTMMKTTKKADLGRKDEKSSFGTDFAIR
jgi:hypothetical protein